MKKNLLPKYLEREAKVEEAMKKNDFDTAAKLDDENRESHYDAVGALETDNQKISIGGSSVLNQHEEILKAMGYGQKWIQNASISTITIHDIENKSSLVAEYARSGEEWVKIGMNEHSYKDYY